MRERDVLLGMGSTALRQPGVAWVGALGNIAGGVVMRARPRAMRGRGQHVCANLLEEMSPAPGANMAWLEAQVHPLAAGFYTLLHRHLARESRTRRLTWRASAAPLLLIHSQLELPRAATASLNPRRGPNSCR